MKIVQVRHRDIPFEDAIAAHPDLDQNKRAEWEAERGKYIDIETPAWDGPVNCDPEVCKGPFYVCCDNGLLVCHHVVEIGD